MTQTLETTAAPRLVLRGTVQVPAQLVFRAAATLLAASHLMGVIDPTLDEEFEQLDGLGFKLCELLMDDDVGPGGFRDPAAIETHAHGCEIINDWLRAFSRTPYKSNNLIVGGALTQKGLAEKVLRYEAEAADIRAAGHALGSAA